MEHFPIFLDLKGRRVVVVGGGAAAAQKLELLLRAGARPLVIAPTISREIHELIEAGAGEWGGAEFGPVCLAGAALVIVAGEDEKLAERISAAAQARDLPVNVVDRPELCSFIMPAIVDRAPVLVAVSTGGRSPTLAQLVRARIEAVLPDTFGRIGEFAGAMRPLVRRLLPDAAQRRAFWRRVLDGPIVDLVLAGRMDRARRATVVALEDAMNTERTGATVHLLRISAPASVASTGRGRPQTSPSRSREF